MKPIIRYTILITAMLVAVWFVRQFFIGSYRITDSKLSDTLHAGDFVFVNKLKNRDNPGRNRMVLYKSPLRRDAAKPPLFIGRCIGVPGDVIQMNADGFRVNGILLPNAPMMQPVFRIQKNIKEPLLSAMDSLRIPLRDATEDSISLSFRMSIREKDLIVQNLAHIVQIEMINFYQEGYEFVLPTKGKPLILNQTSLIACSEAIKNEVGDAAEIRDGKLFIKGEEKTSYLFQKNYYWILSENETGGADSRHLGLIPQDHIIGNIWYCWFSNDAKRRFKKIP